MRSCNNCINIGKDNFCYINDKLIFNQYEAEFCDDYLSEEDMLKDNELRQELNIIKKLDDIIVENKSSDTNLINYNVEISKSLNSSENLDVKSNINKDYIETEKSQQSLNTGYEKNKYKDSNEKIPLKEQSNINIVIENVDSKKYSHDSKNLEVNKRVKCEDCQELKFDFYCKKYKKNIKNIRARIYCDAFKEKYTNKISLNKEGNKVEKHSENFKISSNDNENVKYNEYINVNNELSEVKFSTIGLIKEFKNSIIIQVESTFGVLPLEYKEYINLLDTIDKISEFVSKLNNISNIDEFFLSLGVKKEVKEVISKDLLDSENKKLEHEKKWIILPYNEECENLKLYIEGKLNILSKSQCVLANFIIDNIYEIVNYSAKELANYLSISSSTISWTLTRLRLGNYTSLINQIKGYYK